MAVVPLRSPRPAVEIVQDPEPSGEATITLGDDGLIEIEIGGNQDEPEDPKPGGDAFDRNLAEDLDDMALAALGQYLIEGIESDIEDRADWEDTANRTADYLGIKLNDPVSAPAADGTICQAVATVMLKAGMKLWGTARAELLPVAGPVKVERIATPPAPGIGHNGGPSLSEAEPGQEPQSGSDAAGDDLADALERDLNWYLTKGDRGYYPDFSKMIIHRCWIGNAFREVFRCPIERKPISRWVMAQDLIVSGNPSHLDAAHRVTKRAKVSQSLMRRMQVTGHYRDVPLVHPTGITSNTEIVIGETQGTTPTPTLPRDFDHTVYESCCELGSGTNFDLMGSLALLDQDETGRKVGYPLPYHVSIDYDNRTVLAIRRNWKRGDTDYKKRRRFVKYGFIPGFGFYDLGLIHIVGNPTQAATMLQRSLVDAGIFASFPAWAMAQSAASRMDSTVLRPSFGEVVRVPTTGQTKLSDVMMPWPYKEPSAQSMAMEQKLEADVSGLAGVIEIPVGEGRIGNTPVGTIMSYIESISQVPGAVHKDDHIAQAEEFELLRELLAEEPEVLTRGNKSPARRWQLAEELMQPDISPAADPNTPSQIHRLTKIQGLVAAAGLPQFSVGVPDGPIPNQRAIWKRLTEVLSGEDAAEFTNPPAPPNMAPPPPDPKIVAAQINAQAKTQQVQGEIQKDTLDHQARLVEIAAESQAKDADRASAERVAALHAAAQHVGTVMGHQHDATQNAADRGVDQAQHQDKMALEAAKLTAPLVAPEGGGDV